MLQVGADARADGYLAVAANLFLPEGERRNVSAGGKTPINNKNTTIQINVNHRHWENKVYKMQKNQKIITKILKTC